MWPLFETPISWSKTLISIRKFLFRYLIVSMVVLDTLWKTPFEHGWDWLLRRPGICDKNPSALQGEKNWKTRLGSKPLMSQKTWRLVAYKQNSTEKELEVRLVYVHLSTRPNMKNHQLDVFALPTLKLPMHKDADASNKQISKLQHTMRVSGLQRR